MDLTKIIYKITATLPKEEVYGLVSQMRRAAVSIPSNIAEGKQRNNLKEYIQFLGIAYGSSAELETQMIIASDLFGDKEQYQQAFDLLHQIQKILRSVIDRMKNVSKS
jgi:four helix bundle protein